jgi:hypothetical protein
MRLDSGMSKDFSQNPTANIQRSRFDRRSKYMTTFDGGYVIPIFNDEVLPGDTFDMNATMFARLITPITPIMDNLTMTSFWFAVPLRLLWNNFERFMGAQDDPGDSIDYTIPQIVAPVITGWEAQSIGDYFGLPIGVPNISTNVLYMRAYNLIIRDWFRDENLQDSPIINKGDGPDAASDYPIVRRGKRHDYFTSCLPWPQKGDAITLPLTGDADIYGANMDFDNQADAGNMAQILDAVGGNLRTLATAGNASDPLYGESTGSGTGQLKADMSSVTATTINALREAIALQHFAELEARGGTRYKEIIKSLFNVDSADARLDRPEYLGGRTTNVEIMQVEQTSQSATTPQGTMAGYGEMINRNDGFVKSFTEHMIIIGLVSVNAQLTYQQGIDRAHSRLTRYDFYTPPLAHLGEQAVLNKEIYAQGDANDLLTFGYQERWSEYKYKTSQITGKLRSTYATPLDIWHLSQEFGSLPTLSDAFIQDTPPIDRITSITDEPHIIYDSLLKLKCTRAMPMYSIPGLKRF